jgi:type II secretory pathway pseudopilin PulG
VHSPTDIYGKSVGATAKLANPELTVEPGSEVILEVLVHNSGTQVDEFTLDVLGDAARWTDVGPAALRLFPGQEQVAQVIFRPPRTAQTLARMYPFGINVRSKEDAEGSTVEEGRLVVGAFHDTNAELLPLTSRGSRTGRHRIAIDNRGNVPLSAELAAADGANAATFEVQPRALAAPAGAATFARLRVKPRQRFWRGAPRTLPFEVSVRPKGQSPILLKGSMVQQPVLPAWLPPVAMALAAVLLACVLLWFLLLKPAVQSAAREAMQPTVTKQQAALTAQQKAIDDLQKKAGQPPTSPAPPAAAPTPTPGKVGSGPLGDATDGTLSTKNPTFTVPDKATLTITDVFLENPNGDKGSVVILRRESQDLYSMKLDNFRIQDEHVTTPIVLTAGQKLAWVASGTSAFCYYTGYLKQGS